MFEDSLRKLREIQRKAEQLDGEHSIAYTELFSDEFMLRNTEFFSIASMFDESGFSVESSEAFAAISDEEWDVFIRGRTRFASWEQMKNAAAQDWAMRRLDLE